MQQWHQHQHKKPNYSLLALTLTLVTSTASGRRLVKKALSIKARSNGSSSEFLLSLRHNTWQAFVQLSLQLCDHEQQIHSL